MRSQRRRHSRPAGLPRRATDRIEDLVAWLVITLGLLTVVLAMAVGVRLHDEGVHRVRAEMLERTQVSAVVLDPVPAGVVHGRIVGQARPVPAPVRYTAPDGTDRVAQTRLVGPLPAGSSVPIWVDRSGAVAAAPERAAEVTRTAFTHATGVLIVGLLALAVIWTVVGWGIRRVDMARWGREWAQVEPRWSGRPQQ